MKNIKNLLENSNFMNNQNYIVGKAGKSKIYSNYLKLIKYIKFYSILKEFNSNNFFVIIIGLFPFMLLGLIYISEFVLKSSLENVVGFVFLIFLWLLFPILYYFFVKPNYLYLNINLKDIFFVKLLDIYNSALKFWTIGIRYVFGLISLFLFFMLTNYVEIPNQIRVIVILGFFLLPILFIFIKIENVISYFIFNILAEFEYYINFIIYLINKEKLANKIFLIAPNNYEIKEILEIKDSIVYTDNALIIK